MFVRDIRSGRAALLAVIAVACATLGERRAAMQAPVPTWSGWARCQVDVQGPGYAERQIHTWVTTGGAPTTEGAFRVYPATWSLVGGGSLQRTQGTQTLVAQWAINGSASAPLAVFVRASDGRMLIQARHAQLRAAGAVAGYQQQIIDGKPQTPGRLSSEGFEWAFPQIDAPAANTSVSGSSASGVSGSVGVMQPGGSSGTASCVWTFGQGIAPPAPPPALASVPVPTPPAAVAAVPPTPAPSAAPAAPAAPPQLTAVALPPGIPAVTLTLPVQPTVTTTPNQRTTTSPTGQTATTTPSQATTTSPGQPAATAGTPASGSIAGRTPGGRSMAFTASGTFTVPAGITSFVVETWGGGAGGANGAPSTCIPSGLVCYDGAAGRGGGSGGYTRVALSAPIGTVLEVSIGDGGAAGTGGPFMAATDPKDGGPTRVTRSGQTLALANGGRIDGTGGAAWVSAQATTRPGNDGTVPDGGAAVGGSVAPVGTAGGRGGNGAFHLCGGIGPAVPCARPGWPGAAGLPGYALITW